MKTICWTALSLWMLERVDLNLELKKAKHWRVPLKAGRIRTRSDEYHRQWTPDLRLKGYRSKNRKNKLTITPKRSKNKNKTMGTRSPGKIIMTGHKSKLPGCIFSRGSCFCNRLFCWYEYQSLYKHTVEQEVIRWGTWLKFWPSCLPKCSGRSTIF